MSSNPYIYMEFGVEIVEHGRLKTEVRLQVKTVSAGVGGGL